MHADAVRFDEISYTEAHRRGLRVMDLTAITMAQENNIPILVFNMNERGNLKRLLLGENVATIVRS
jgi:uridylate kinase